MLNDRTKVRKETNWNTDCLHNLVGTFAFSPSNDKKDETIHYPSSLLFLMNSQS